MEHIGSTSVPGLGAKLIIDISTSVPSLDDVSSLQEVLKEKGYLNAQINPIFQRRLFCKGPFNEGMHSLHFTVHVTETWADPILLRDYLRARPDMAAEYQHIKTVAAARHGRDLDGYYEGPEGKRPFVDEIMEAARLWRTRQTGLSEAPLSDDPAGLEASREH